MCVVWSGLVWSAGRLIVWLIGCLVDWLIGCLVDWLIGCLLWFGFGCVVWCGVVWLGRFVGYNRATNESFTADSE
jgi:hypothetical protein